MTAVFFLLNIIQAISEFLPISSSGHLIVTEWLYGISEHGLEAFLHLPTALAIAIVFFPTFWQLLKERKTWPVLLIALLPAGIVGFLAGDYLDAIFYSPIVVGINQVLWGCILWYTAVNYTQGAQQGKLQSWKELTLWQSLRIGLAQTLALIPGTSRSGITTLAGIGQGMAPSESAKFSFIAGFPLIAAASLIGFAKLYKAGEFLPGLPLWVLLGGMIVSLLLSMVFAKLFTSRHALTVMKVSGIYRILLGFLILSWLT
jgi:undecaprenyl-diphosphatase